jgi:hypothetical protein
MVVGRDISYSGSAWPQPNDIAFLATDRTPHFDTDFTTSASRAAAVAVAAIAASSSTSSPEDTKSSSSTFKPLYHPYYLLPPSSAQLTSQYVAYVYHSLLFSSLAFSNCQLHQSVPHLT